jgi:hypothetical protein
MGKTLVEVFALRKFTEGWVTVELAAVLGGGTNRCTLRLEADWLGNRELLEGLRGKDELLVVYNPLLNRRQPLLNSRRIYV